MKQVKVIHGVTVSKSLSLMSNLPTFFNNKGFNFMVISSNGEEVNRFIKEEKCNLKIIEMEREISPFKDFISLIKVINFFLKEKPDIVNAGTPKAGLLIMLASKITNIPIRIYTIRGLRLETTKGIKRKILIFTEKIAIACSTNTLAISNSLKSRVVELNLNKNRQIDVLGQGSSNGIHLSRFNSSMYEVETIMDSYGISENDFILGFVGRVTKDKGIEDLVQIFLEVKEKIPETKLLIVGEFEEGDPVSEEIKKIILEYEDIIYTGHQRNPSPFYLVMDIFLFLTKREGFGNVAIEAGLSKIPVIAKNVTGAKDTIINNKTGFIIDNNNEAVDKVLFLYNNSKLRQAFGQEGHEWVKKNFSQDVVHNNIYQYYLKLLKKNNIG